MTQVSPIYRLPTRIVTIIAMLAMVLMACGTARAEPPRASVQSIEKYLDTTAAGKKVLTYMHLGADYRGHKLLAEYAVEGKPNNFAVEYRYLWASDGITDLMFYCDKNGSVYDVRVTYTNAVFNQPFVLAQASIKILSQAILNASKLSPEQKAILQKLVDAEDVKGMLVFDLP